MTNGIIIFAQNNTEVDYIKLATFAAKQANKYLKFPVSIITDSKYWLEKSQPDHPFDQILEVEFTPAASRRPFFDGTLSSKQLEWRNFARNQAYDLSPYNQTLVIDSDYIINSSLLKSAFDLDHDFQIYSNSMDLAEWRSLQEFTRINPYSVPFYWATAFIFKKTPSMKSFFDLVAYIKYNWEYYKKLYNIDTTIFRNDYAFSIAIHIMNGKTDGGFATELPGKMIFTKDRDILVAMDSNKMKFLIEKKHYPGEYTLAKTDGLDVHVMNKFSLSRFIDGGSGV